jgi:hypothetical protein
MPNHDTTLLLMILDGDSDSEWPMFTGRPIAGIGYRAMPNTLASFLRVIRRKFVKAPDFLLSEI